jgi:general secretion pathway protein A
VYEDFYGLKERAFSLTPDPRFLYMTPGHREALSNLMYGVAASRAITLLTGEAGTGKTTLVRTALANAQPGTSHVVVSNPRLTRGEFIGLLASEFGLSREAAQSKDVWLGELEVFLRERHAKGLITALVVDEAQSLPDNLLEEIRLLSNIETETEKLMPIVLTGQPELATRLNQPSLRQLKQRVALRCQLAPFDLAATVSYIAARLRTAGGQPSAVFTLQAAEYIHRAARGIPRTINVLCDNALLSGFAAGARPVGMKIVAEVCADFEFGAAAVAVDEPRPRSVDEKQGDTCGPAPMTALFSASAPSEDGMARPRWLSFLWTRN